ncbi:MAG: hypothetical protein IJR97_09515 [Clostridia bacterium]|nr:hypothetical protein [Clostridia bacterium]
MDQFMEEVSTKRQQGMATLMIAVANVMMILLALFAVVTLNSLINYAVANGFDAVFFYNLVILLFCAGCAVLLFFKRDTLRTDYEYTFTNGILDFAQVFNNKKRKNLGTMNLKNIEACGEVSSGSFNRYISMPGIKKNNWFANRDGKLFYLYFSKDNVKRIIIIEPSEEMANLIRRAVNPGVYQIN